ncbi:hypothetical protein A9Q83_03075 [Alphaproteobacteria bacterium 46_93_T64]|nr:hypothetical protein A9Q83_03075 [Alphaproteobacteria bacterium 46_93_T64]
MSSDCKLSKWVNAFLSWHQNELAPFSEGLEIIKNSINIDAVSFSVYAAEAREISLFKQVPNGTIQPSDTLALIEKQFETNDKRWAPESPQANSLFSNSYVTKNKNATRGTQTCLWNSHPFEFDTATQTFLDMACPLIGQKYIQSTPNNAVPHFIAEAFSAVSDGFVLYDNEETILAFNDRQTTLFPSVAGKLEIGNSYKTILQKQLQSGQIDIPEEEQENWINRRRANLKIHGFTEEQKFDSGKTIRLTNYCTESGGTVAIRTDITELVAARQKALENEKLFRTLLVGAPIPLLITIDGQYVYGNKYAHELFELNDGELVGRRTEEFYWDTKDRVDVLEEIKREKSLKGSEVDIRTAKGNQKTVFTSGAFINYQGQEALFISLLDISDSVKIKNTLAQNEKQIREILELIPDALLVQVEGEIKYVNDGAVKIFNTVSKDNMIGTPSLALAAESERGKVLDLRKQALEGKRAKSFSSESQKFDGTTFPSETYVKSVLWDGERGTLAIIRDISKRRDYEDKLIQNETEMALAQQIGGFGHFRMNLSDRSIFWSKELYRMYDLDPDTTEISIEQAQSFFGKEEHASLTNTIRKIIAEKTSRNFTVEVQLKNGSLRHMVGTMLPETDKDGKVNSIFGVIQDTTDQRELEEKLRQSQKMEAVGQLTGGVAHDFNNLLAIILGNTELLMEMIDLQDYEKRSRLEIVMQACKRGADLTNSMLAFGRTQQLLPTISRLDLQVTDMINVLDRTIEEDIDIKFITEADLWSCLADLGQVENTLLNLALNARDAMIGGGNLVIETKNATLSEGEEYGNLDCDPGDYVMLSVSDTGSGIDPKNLDHVFEPFYTTKDVGQGTGLGLSMVYGFIKQSNGHITIASELGVGTTVKLYLPRAKEKLRV